MDINGKCADGFGRVREAFAANFADHRDLGAAVSVVVDGECVVDLWGGHLDRERTQPWPQDAIVCVYSTTKGMTALCAHMLVDRGQLDLERPVADYWPEFAQAGKGSIPVAWLLNHKAGVVAFAERIELDELIDWGRACARLASQAPAWEPGTATGYHSTTYGFLVGEVIRRVDGRTVGRFFDEEVAVPVGLGGDFYIGVPDAEHHRIAPLIDPPGGEEDRDTFLATLTDIGRLAMGNQPISTTDSNRTEVRRAELPGSNGHGNARGIARVYGELARGEILSEATLDAALEPQGSGTNLSLGLDLEWRLGFMANNGGYGPSPRAFGHNGMGGSVGFADPDHRVGFSYTPNEVRVAELDLRGWYLQAAVYECLGVS